MLPEVLSPVKHRNSELGFSLVEILTVLAILGLIIGPTSAAAITMMKMSSWDADLNLHLRQVQNAGYQVLSDGLMAQTVSTTKPKTFLSLSWTDWNGNSHVVDYLLVENTIRRSLNGGEPYVVAERIDMTTTTARWNEQQGQLTVTIASVGTRMTRIQQVYIVRPRAWVGGG